MQNIFKMLIKTHLAITGFFILLFISAVEHKAIFILTSILATYLPDVDSRFSTIGQKFLSRILQFFTKHRGVLHSFSFLFLVTLVLALFFPIISLGFFLGYSSHLIADSFTLDGIRPFYPLKKMSSGKISTGGIMDSSIFYSFIVVDLVLIVVEIMRI